jgi:hypothetical protein
MDEVLPHGLEGPEDQELLVEGGDDFVMILAGKYTLLGLLVEFEDPIEEPFDAGVREPMLILIHRYLLLNRQRLLLHIVNDYTFTDYS